MPFAIHNMIRSRRTRTRRAHAPEHPRLVQRVGNLRVLRARSLVLTDADFERHLAEIRQKVSLGHIEVRTLDGRNVDLETMELAPVAAAPPLPAPPLDSIERDPPWGERIPRLPGEYDDAPGPDGADGVPALVRAARDPGEEEEKEEKEETEPPAAANVRHTKRGRR